MEGIRRELSVAELCRKYAISDTTYYKWSKDYTLSAFRRGVRIRHDFTAQWFVLQR